jgi:hypothetical protein
MERDLTTSIEEHGAKRPAQQFPCLCGVDAPGLPGRSTGRNPALREHDNYVIQAMENNNILIAGEEEDAYLGMGSVEVRAGDWVYVLMGKMCRSCLGCHRMVREWKGRGNGSL